MMTLQYNKVFCLSSPRDRCPDAFFIALSFFPLLIIPPLSLLSFLLSLHSFVILVRWMNSMTMMTLQKVFCFITSPRERCLAYHLSFISPLIPPVSSSISRVVCTCVVACYAWGTKYCSQRRLNEWKYYLYAIWWCVAYHSSLPQLACSILTTTYQYCFSAQYNTTRQEYRAQLYFKKDPGPGRAVQLNQE